MISSADEFIPYGRQSISENDIQAVADVLSSPMLTQGPVLPQFETAIADKVNAQYGVAVNSATSALHIACLALGLGPGEWLWTSPITFVASANCALYCGASVDFVDINPTTGLMDVSALQLKLQQAKYDGKLPKIVVPVHLAGSSCDMQAIGCLAKEYGFMVIEDASHAIGGFYNANPVGACEFSQITVFSFHPVKIITTGEGGIATTNSRELAIKMSRLRSHGITKDINEFQHAPVGPWSYEQQDLGFNYRMTDFQAALGLSQLKRLNYIINERNKIYEIYLELTLGLPVYFLRIPDNVKSALHLAILRLSNLDSKFHLNLFKHFRDSNVGVQLHYSPIHLQPYYRNIGFTPGMFPESESYATNAISLPIYPGLTLEQQSRVINVLTEFLNL